MMSSAENYCIMKFYWPDIFPEPIKFRVTSRLRIGRHYEVSFEVTIDVPSQHTKLKLSQQCTSTNFLLGGLRFHYGYENENNTRKNAGVVASL